MPSRAKGHRRGKKTRHISLTDMAADVYTQLLRSGIVAYPGPISANGGGGSEPRITLSIDDRRHRITIAHSGTQTLYVYGIIDLPTLEQVLKRFVGDNLKVRSGKT